MECLHKLEPKKSSDYQKGVGNLAYKEHRG